MTPEQQAALDAANARIAARQQAEERNAAVPTQRRRTAMQGLSLGFADEIEARARSLATGRPYQEVLDEIRGQIKAYQEARPKEAMAYEIGGAALPAIGSILAAPFTGGGSLAAAAPTAARLLPSLGRMAGVGAVEGGLYAFGTGEGGAGERMSRVPGGAAGGAVGGAVGGAALKGIAGATNLLADSARRLVGRRGSTIVENEIQRLAEQSGRTADEISADILSGRLMAENETIRQAVRNYHAQGGEAQRMLIEGLQNRPAQTREAAMQELRTYLSDVNEPSALQAQRRSDEAVSAAERQAYAQFKEMPASQEIQGSVLAELQVVPEAVAEINKMFRGLVNVTPPQVGQGPAQVSFTRNITLDEAERVRRAIANAASAEYRAGYGGAGEAFSAAEQRLRSALDVGSPELAGVRAEAAAVRAQRNNFELGQKALVGDVNERLYEFSKLTTPEQVNAYRAGLMAALEARATTGSRQSLIRNLLNQETRESKILNAVFPQDQLKNVIDRLTIASEAQDTAQTVLRGSDTARTLAEASRQGMGLSMAEMAGVLNGSPDAIISVGRKVSQRFARGLTDAERARVVGILLSEDPNIVRNAIIDESGMAKFQRALENTMAKVTTGARRASTVAGAEPAANVSQATLRGLLAQ